MEDKKKNKKTEQSKDDEKEVVYWVDDQDKDDWIEDFLKGKPIRYEGDDKDY